MYCSNCGGVVAAGKKFCTRCGAAVANRAGAARGRSLSVWLILPWVCLLLLVGAVAFLVVGGYFGLGRAVPPPEASQVQAQFRPELPPPPPPPPAASPKRSAPFAAGQPGGVVGGVIGGVVPAQEPPPPPAAQPSSPQPIRVSGNVQQAKLVRQVRPAYPALAKQARIQGTVRFTAVIGKDGAIAQLQLTSGHPLLVPSAQEAVRQWVYQPTLLNGEPVEVVTQIDVVFSLGRE